MLDADAIQWWEKLQKDGKLTQLSRAYQYVDFTDRGGRRIEIRSDDTIATGKIGRLAARIEQDLENAPQEIDEKIDPRPSFDVVDVVVLGHATAALPQEMEDHVRKLCESLKSRDLRFEEWRDEWRKNADARGKAGAGSDVIFVQPVAKGEASDRASDGAISKFLEEAGIRESKVVLWLPQGFSDPEFSDAAAKAAAVAKATNSTKFPALRVDSPDGLAAWLKSFYGQVQSADETRIKIQTIGITEADVNEQSVSSLRIINQLKEQIYSTAFKFVDNPRPTPPPLSFWGKQFSEHLKKLNGNRTIVAIHDLDVAPGPEGSIQKQLQLRFDAIQEALQEEQESRASTGRPPLKAFLAALLVRSAGALPFNEYPYDGRYGQWSLLGFAPPNGEGPDETAPLKPDPYSLAVLSSKLYSWAHAAPQSPK